ncbi:hypothetical protein KAR91_07010 [Candidatus Pacearchaeota archaeon]|nr:hypothetical protein [Candidatus Pacearchaeota archaeon]
MAEVGSLQIGGSVDTQAIENGLARVEGGLKNISAVGDSVNSDFIRINQNTKELGKNLKIIAVAGVGAMIGLAKGAPAVAGAMANMKVSFGKLTRTLGDSLSPAFDNVSEAFSGFVGWIQQNGPTISEFSVNIISGLVGTLRSLNDIWGAISQTTIPFFDIEIGEGLKYIVNTFGAPAITGLAVGKFFGPVAGIAAAGVTAVSQSDPQTGYSPLLGVTGGAIGAAAGPVGIGIGFGIGALIGWGIDSWFGKQDRKSNSLDLEYAT